MAWRLAMWPTSRLPASVTATIDGVVLYPPRFGIPVGCPFSTIATHEFVVPRSMPITFSIRSSVLSSSLAGSFQEGLDVSIVGRESRGRFELAPRVERQPSRNVDFGERDAVLHLLRIERDRALGECSRGAEIAA